MPRKTHNVYPGGRLVLPHGFWGKIKFPERSCAEILQSPCTTVQMVATLNKIRGVKLPDDWGYVQIYTYRGKKSHDSFCRASYIPVAGEDTLIIHTDDAETICKAIENIGHKAKTKGTDLFECQEVQDAQTDSYVMRRIGGLQGSISQIFKRVASIEKELETLKEVRKLCNTGELEQKINIDRNKICLLMVRVAEIKNWIQTNFPDTLKTTETENDE